LNKCSYDLLLYNFVLANTVLTICTQIKIYYDYTLSTEYLTLAVYYAYLFFSGGNQ